MKKTVDSAITSVRRIASELRPSILDDVGLIEALEVAAAEFQTRTGIMCRVECGGRFPQLDQQQSTALFRIMQEALTNVLRHSSATQVVIVLRARAGEAVMVITDNGQGIKPVHQESPHALGLIGMRERSRLIGGEVVVIGEEGRGTTVVVRLPLDRTERHIKRS